MNIKISDLSIGDYISYCDRVYKVHSIEGQGLVGASNDSYSSPHILKHVDYLEPIPITVDILEKNGWEFFKDSRWWILETDMDVRCNVWLGRNNECRVEVSCKNEELDYYSLYADIQLRKAHIHQLQHALRLAGVNKEIKL